MINLFFVLYNFHISNYCKSLVDNFDNFEGFLVLILVDKYYCKSLVDKIWKLWRFLVLIISKNQYELI
jgi:hypothetical protein